MPCTAATNLDHLHQQVKQKAEAAAEELKRKRLVYVTAADLDELHLAQAAKLRQSTLHQEMRSSSLTNKRDSKRQVTSTLNRLICRRVEATKYTTLRPISDGDTTSLTRLVGQWRTHMCRTLRRHLCLHFVLNLELAI